MESVVNPEQKNVSLSHSICGILGLEGFEQQNSVDDKGNSPNSTTEETTQQDCNDESENTFGKPLEEH